MLHAQILTNQTYIIFPLLDCHLRFISYRPHLMAMSKNDKLRSTHFGGFGRMFCHIAFITDEGLQHLNLGLDVRGLWPLKLEQEGIFIVPYLL